MEPLSELVNEKKCKLKTAILLVTSMKKKTLKRVINEVYILEAYRKYCITKISL